MHLFKSGKLHRAAAAFMVFMLCFTFEAALAPRETKAADNLLGDASWQFLFASPMSTVTGVVQSICVTDYYIITIENVADSADTLDIVLLTVAKQAPIYPKKPRLSLPSVYSARSAPMIPAIFSIIAFVVFVLV